MKRYKTKFLATLGVACVSLMTYANAATEKPDWMQESANGQDIAVSHTGAQWFIGKDGKAYQWDVKSKSWNIHGSRSNFKRIDAGAGGAAALTESGQLYVTSDTSQSWQPTGIIGNDVGIGGGTIWVADAQLGQGQRATLKGTFSESGKIDWDKIEGRLERLDVDPQGRAWGLDNTGALFVYADGQWMEDAKAPTATDIGIGGDGSLYVVGNDMNAELGGGRVYQRNAANGAWSAVAGRLSAISVTENGQPVGINSKSWLIAGTMVASSQAANLGTDKNMGTNGPNPTLESLAGGLSLPASLLLAEIESLDDSNPDISYGSTWLNGLKTYVAIIKHADSDVPSVALGHDSMTFENYMPEAGGTAFAALGLIKTPVFLFVDESNAGKKFPEIKTPEFTFLAKADSPEEGYTEGLHMLGALDLKQIPDGQSFAYMFGLKNTDLAFNVALSPDLFMGVEFRESPPVNSPDLVIEDIITKYQGTALFDTARLTIPLAFSGADPQTKTIGPLDIRNPVLEFGWGEDIEFVLNMDLAAKVEAKNTAVDLLVLKDVKALVNVTEKSATLTGDITLDAVNDIMPSEEGQSLYKMTSADFEGSFEISDDGNLPPTALSDFEEFSMAVAGLGTMTTPQGDAKSNVGITLSLESNEGGDKLVPTISVTSDMTLADIVGDKVPGASKIMLSNFKASTDYIEGTVMLDGSPVRAVLYEPKGEQAIIGLEHESVDLGSYIPPIRDTSLGSFGLANAILFVMPEDASPVVYEALTDVPKPLSPLLKKGAYEGLFPLTVHPGVTVIGTYSPAEDGNAAAVMKAYGISENGYAVSGHFKLSQFSKPKFSKFNPRVKADKNAVCNAVVGDVSTSGLDLSFPIPDFAPSYGGGSIAFSSATFALKDIDGKIEPAIVTGMALRLPEAQAGIDNIPMAAKLSVQGDLDVLCNGIDEKTNGSVSFAASTALNAAQVGNIAFDALARVTNEEAEDKGKAEQPKDAKQIGWKNPFGIPFLTIRQYASSGTFDQQTENDGSIKRTLKTKVWTDSQLGRADLDLYGSADYLITPNELVIEDWSFKAPGPIALNDLPALQDFPKVDEFLFRDIDLEPAEMTGTLEWPSKNVSADAYLSATEKADKTTELSFFTLFDRLQPDILSDKFPPVIADVQFSSAVIGWSNAETHDLQMSSASERLVPLFDGLVAEDESITVAKGFTFAGVTDAQPLLDGSLNKLLDLVSFEDDLVLLGALEVDAAGAMNGEITAKLGTIKVKNIPDTLMSFDEAELVLSSLNGNKIEIKTTASVKVPEKTEPVIMKGTLTYIAESESKNTLSIELESNEFWNNPLFIPDLQISDLGFEAAFVTDGVDQTQEMAFTGDGVFREQSGKVGISFASENGSLDDAVLSFEGSLDIGQLMELPPEYSSVANAKISKLLISTNAVAGDLTLTLGGQQISGRGAVINDNGKKALFVRNDAPVAVGQMVPNTPVPLDALEIPQGVLIISSQDIPSFNAGDIPDTIYDDVLGELVEDDVASSLLVEDGVTFLTKMNVSGLPEPISTILQTPFGVKDEVFFAGSVGGLFGGDSSLGFYTVLKDVTPNFPDFVDNFIEFKNANLKVFVKTSSVDNNVSIGIGADAFIKARRLDDPTVVQKLDSELSLVYEATPTGNTILGRAAVKGVWADPLGLEGYALTNPSVAFGQEEKGTTIEIHTERAEFNQGGQTKAFVFDLDTTWLGVAPTALSIQLGITDDTADLVLTPVDLARVQKSIFDLALRSGSNLSNAVVSKLREAKGFTDAEVILLTETGVDPVAVMNTFAGKISDAGDGMFSLIENSPLSMIGVENPVIYFGTPGSTPPSNPNIPRPPLGLGLHVAGSFVVDTGGLKADLANGLYKVNLLDGYYVNGSVTPPAPFASNLISVTGNMPLIGGPQYLSFKGKLEVPNLKIAGVSMSVDGTFDVSRGSMFDRNASVHANANIAGLFDREGSMTLTDTSLSFNLPATCTSIPPLDLKGTINLKNLSPESFMNPPIFIPMVPNPVDCMVSLAELGKAAVGATVDAAKSAANKTKDFVEDPIGTTEETINDAVENLGDLGSDPLGNARNIGTMPLSMAELGADVGISLVKMGVEKIPVLGPGAGKAIGEGFDKAKDLKNFAMNQIANNAATQWLENSVGAAVGAVANVAGAVSGWASDATDWATGGSSSNPVWHRPNPLRCMVGRHHWNDVFKQCFENSAVVLFDESSRHNNKLGDCIRFKYWSEDTLTIDKCFGDGSNQFHMDSITNQIKSSSYNYNGWTGGWYGPGQPLCMTRHYEAGIGDHVYLDSCHENRAYNTWAYTDDMKLRNGNECLTRQVEVDEFIVPFNNQRILTETSEAVMGDCATATKWLGTSVVPNWNEVEGIPMRGRIMNKASGLCMYWTYPSGPFTLVSCDKKNEGADDIELQRTHVRLRVIDGNQTVEITGARFWNGHVMYGCMGVSGDQAQVHNCNPDTYYDDNKWKIYPVNSNGGLDQSGNIAMKDVLKNYDYVFYNPDSGKCLSVDAADVAARTKDQKKEDINYGMNNVRNSAQSCTAWGGKVREDVKFRGYTADNLAMWVLIEAREKEEAVFMEARNKLRKNIQDWQRWRIRQENARLDKLFKDAAILNTDIKVAQNYRQSPGSCVHGAYWDQDLKSCAKGERTRLLYHDTDGAYKGCLRTDTLNIYQNCDINNTPQALIDRITVEFDDRGRIRTKNSDGKDICLTDSSNYRNPPDGTRVGFFYCSDTSMNWGFTPSGEIVTKDGRCLRETLIDSQKYDRAAAHEFNNKLNAGYAEITARYKEQYKDNIAARDQAIAAFRAPIYARSSGGLSPEDNGLIAEEYERLNTVHGIDEMGRLISEERSTFKKDLQASSTFFVEAKESIMVLKDCNTDPMDIGSLRWLPLIGENSSAKQGLPETAKIKLSNDNNLCVTADMSLFGGITIETCDAENKDQYFALGGVNNTHFLISPRNSKTCVNDNGQDTIGHRPCKANAPEAFSKIEGANGNVKFKNLASGKCFALGGSTVQAGQNIVQTNCDNAPEFTMEAIASIDGIGFANLTDLTSDDTRTVDAQVLWEKAKKREEYMYAGVYLQKNDLMLHKGDDDTARMIAPTTMTLKPLPWRPGQDIPAVEAPITNIILVPGFEDGANHVSFVHSYNGTPNKFNNLSTPDKGPTDPYASPYIDWFLSAHLQKVMHVGENNAVKFDLIDEASAFQKSATFKMVPGLSGVAGTFSFESVSNSGRYLQNTNGVLTLGSNPVTASFDFESTTKWMAYTEAGAPERRPRPRFEGWKYPETGYSALTYDFESLYR